MSHSFLPDNYGPLTKQYPPEANGLNKKKLTHMGLFTGPEIVVGAYTPQ